MTEAPADGLTMVSRAYQEVSEIYSSFQSHLAAIIHLKTSHIDEDF